MKIEEFIEFRTKSTNLSSPSKTNERSFYQRNGVQKDGIKISAVSKKQKDMVTGLKDRTALLLGIHM